MICPLQEIRERMVLWLETLAGFAQRALAADPDPEVYHGLRVHARRLRTGLSLVGSLAGPKPPKRFVELDEGLKRLARAIGPIRDADVLEQHLADVVGALTLGRENPMWRACVDLIRDRLTQERDEVKSGISGVTELGDPFLSRARQLVQSIGLPADATPVVDGIVELWTAEFAIQARRAIAVDHPGEWHALRLLGKRLRYAIELTLDREHPSPFHERLIRVQQTLGRAHDHRVWERLCLWLRNRLKRRGRDALPRAGLAALAKEEERDARRLEIRFANDWRTGLGSEVEDADPHEEPPARRSDRQEDARRSEV